MIKSKNKKLIVGLEIGTSKVATLIGEIAKNNKIDIIGMGHCLSHGMNKYGINDLESITNCIQKSIRQAETMANCQISSVYLAVSGRNINCQNEIGIVPILEDEVTKEDVDNVIYTAQSVQTKTEHHILHIIPQEYSIDHQSGIKNPIGLSGMRMKAKVHLITCHDNTKKNIIKAVEKCGLRVNKLIFSGLASSEAILTQEERELGVCSIDIGGGTIDFTIYINGSIQHSQVIPYAGNMVTNDIAYAFSTSKIDAEIIKLKYGCAMGMVLEKSENIEIQTLYENKTQKLQKKMLIEVIEPRYIELLSLINHEIQKILYQNKFKNQLEGGIVLTGGASKIRLLTKCAEKIFKTKVRIGYPINVTSSIKKITEPEYSTLIGLLHHGKNLYPSDEQNTNQKKSIKTWFNYINDWFKKEF